MRSLKGPEEEVLALPPHSKPKQKRKDQPKEHLSEKVSRSGENRKRKR
jgi:hypothetical protein